MTKICMFLNLFTGMHKKHLRQGVRQGVQKTGLQTALHTNPFKTNDRRTVNKNSLTHYLAHLKNGLFY